MFLRVTWLPSDIITVCTTATAAKIVHTVLRLLVPMYNDHLVSSIYKSVPDTERTYLLFNLNYPREASHNADVLQPKYISVWFHLDRMKVCLALFLNHAKSQYIFKGGRCNLVLKYHAPLSPSGEV